MHKASCMATNRRLSVALLLVFAVAAAVRASDGPSAGAAGQTAATAAEGPSFGAAKVDPRRSDPRNPSTDGKMGFSTARSARKTAEPKRPESDEIQGASTEKPAAEGHGSMLQEFWYNFRHNLFKPLLLFFYMGFLFVLMKVKLEFPNVVYQGLTIYLLIAIGWHGGEELAQLPASSLSGALGFMVMGFV